jgi:hypothetical protein
VKIKEKNCEIHMKTVCARKVPTDLSDKQNVREKMYSGLSAKLLE